MADFINLDGKSNKNHINRKKERKQYKRLPNQTGNVLLACFSFRSADEQLDAVLAPRASHAKNEFGGDLVFRHTSPL